MTVWRLLTDPPAPAAWNMAVDEALAAAVGAGLSPPTLRLYAWRPAAVSIGYFQHLDEALDRQAVRARGWGWVRRPSGGRAVLHDDELTYAVAAPDTGSVLEAYARLSRCLIAGLVRLGVAAEWAAPARGHSTACFDAPSTYEVAVGGRKLVGSAQTRRCGALLQHGSLPLSLDRAAHAAVLRGGPRLEAALAERACALSEVAPSPPGWAAVAAALAAGFRTELDVDLRAGVLAAAEWRAAADLVRERYATEAWNARR